ncbi:hypothetical protein GGS21DRAFT_493834 [Xylaria nigripes]|nr:hypothetical protein GGS21DRAFT_493834 [Xylaria nigripes]
MASRKPKDPKVTEDIQYANATPFRVLRTDGTEMPSEYSQYEKVEEGAKAIIEWQNKLGQALAAELIPGATGLFYLQEFPTHYHLRWYQAKEETKNQAKHYYLFGYPEESSTSKARKYYRSPNHFLPHLIWLISQSKDKGDCACEFCSGSKPITSKTTKMKIGSSSQQESWPAATTTNLAPTASAGNATTNIVVDISNIPAPKITSLAPIAKTKPPSHHSTMPQQPTLPDIQKPMLYQPQSPKTSPDVSLRAYTVHDHDSLFRAGEIVWYKYRNSWRLGMILISRASLTIFPFSHPLYPTREIIKEEADIRPFLAFSIPQINSALQEFKGRAISQIDWKSLQERFDTLTDPNRQEGLAIEATKLAASRVDQCYSTFNPIQSEQIYSVYGGVFLGAEKICIGEAVRIHLSREQRDQTLEKGMPVVMVIKRVIIMGREEGANLMFEGDLWKLQHVNLAQQQQAPNHSQLPTAMLGEKQFRDGFLKSRGWCVEWFLMSQGMSVNESAIRGRFYETQRLTPILNPSKFQEMLRQQNVDDIQTLLNNRADSGGPRVGRVRNRAQAVIGAVPNSVLGALNLEVMEE